MKRINTSNNDVVRVLPDSDLQHIRNKLGHRITDIASYIFGENNGKITAIKSRFGMHGSITIGEHFNNLDRSRRSSIIPFGIFNVS